MYKNTLYEKNNTVNKIKELFILAMFTIVIAVISLVVMDILILPLSTFAINNKEIYNFIIKDVSVFLIIFLLFFLLLRKILGLHRDGLTKKEIAKYLFRRPFYYFSIFLFLLFSSAVIIFILYILLSFNNNLLHKFSIH